MVAKEVYKPIIKKFLGKEVRVITVGINEYIVLKDMFLVLGRLDNDGDIPTTTTRKLNRFLTDIGRLNDRKSFTVNTKQKGVGRHNQDVPCLLIDTVPIVLTQFEPTARKGENARTEWIEFMKFVDNLLREHEAYKVILKDKEEQKSIAKTISEETDGKMVIINTQISIIMAKLIGVYEQGIKKINKDELKIYQPQVTIDLIEVRQEALKIFEQQYLVLEDYKQASDFTVAYMKKKYHLK